MASILFQKADAKIIFVLPQAKHKIAEVEHALAVSEAYSKAAAEAEVGEPLRLFYHLFRRWLSKLPGILALIGRYIYIYIYTYIYIYIIHA